MKIIPYPDSILRKRCKSVNTIDDSIRQDFKKMADAMYLAGGVGLAANQIGIDKRLIVVDVGDGLIKMANPVILRKEGSSVMEEGCLCLPGITIKVKRAKKILVEGINDRCEKQVIEAQGLKAHAFQQEIDHINGVLIIDYASLTRRWQLRNKLKALGVKK